MSKLQKKRLTKIEDYACTHCGVVDDIKVELPPHITGLRSRKEHNILFGYIGLCCDNWPEQYEYQPENGDPEHLRAWALIRIGHCRALTVTEADGSHEAFINTIGSFVSDRYFETYLRGDVVTILAPRSIATGKNGIDRKAYNRITKSVEELLHPIVGLSIDDYKEWKKVSSPAREPAHDPH